VIGAILNIIASILRLIPGWKEKRIDRAEGEWRNNRDSIDRDLGTVAWWVRDNQSNDEHDRGR
jgi:hypothetical protein